MRALHRDVGFFVVGLIVIYSLSGMVLVYRDVGFLVSDVQVETQLSPGIDPTELGRMLRIKGFKVTKTDGDTVYFQDGSYDQGTGLAVYKTKSLPTVLQKFVNLHKTTSGNVTHWYALLFGGMLCFLAISSFWMFDKGTRVFRRGLYMTSAGIVITAVVLLI
jgi:hypothetical protein